MMTTITVASIVALILNKITTGEFTKPANPAPIGTTIYTKLLEKKTPDEVRLSVMTDKLSETNRDEKTNL